VLDWLHSEPSTIRQYFDEHPAIRKAFVAAFAATLGSQSLPSTPSTSCTELDRAAEGQLDEELQQSSICPASPNADSPPETGRQQPNISPQGQHEPASDIDAPYDLDEQNEEPRPSRRHHRALSITSQASHTSPPNFHSRYAQVLSIMTSMFGSSLTLAKISIVIKTSDKLIRDDATAFLRDQLPLWKGIWCQSNLPMPLSDDSVTNRFVKVSQYISILEERSIMNRVRILFHRVLQY
jgi:hypothetical protein